MIETPCADLFTSMFVQSITNSLCADIVAVRLLTKLRRQSSTFEVYLTYSPPFFARLCLHLFICKNCEIISGLKLLETHLDQDNSDNFLESTDFKLLATRLALAVFQQARKKNVVSSLVHLLGQQTDDVFVKTASSGSCK